MGEVWGIPSALSPAACTPCTPEKKGLFPRGVQSLKQTGEFLCLPSNYMEVKGLLTPFSLE